MAKGMINMALWDIFGKYYNKPVFQCLAEKFNIDKTQFNHEIPLLYPFGIQTIEKDLEMIHEKWEQG